MKTETPSKVSIETTLYPPGTGFLHTPSYSKMLLTQDARNKRTYYLTTITNLATPEQNFTTTTIGGSRDDGLLEHEIEQEVCFWESKIVNLVHDVAEGKQ